MSNYQEYVPFHTDYTPEEKILFRQYETGEVVPNQGKLGVIFAKRIPPSPTAMAHIYLAYGRAQAHFQKMDRVGIYPEGVKDVRGFEGMDAKGHYGRHDLGFVKRTTLLKQVAKNANPEVQNTLLGCLAQFKTYDTVANSLYIAFCERCKLRRLSTHAMKLVHSEEGYAWLRDGTNLIGPLVHMQHVLNGLDYLAGIGCTKPPTEELKKLNTVFGLSEERLHKLRDLRFSQGEKAVSLTVIYANFDHALTQSYLANPAHWGAAIPEIPTDYTSPEEAQIALELYAKNSVASLLDGLYDPIEELMDDSAISLNSADYHRTKLITVDGKTVDQLIKAYYEKLEHEPLPFLEWLVEFGMSMTATIVSAGLMAGKQVVANLLGEDERVIEITKAGYEPNLKKPNTAIAWEGFVEKYGFQKNLEQWMEKTKVPEVMTKEVAPLEPHLIHPKSNKL